jgi:hypothetical protein
METRQCRLCLAEIPYDDDNNSSLDTTTETSDSEEPDQVAFDYINDPQLTLIQQKEQWPDSAATAGVLFILFILNASLFIVWLIFGNLCLRDFESDTEVSWKVTTVYSISGVCCFSNGLMVYVSERFMGSRLITCVSVLFGLFWCGVMIWVKSKA